MPIEDCSEWATVAPSTEERQYALPPALEQVKRATLFLRQGSADHITGQQHMQTAGQALVGLQERQAALLAGLDALRHRRQIIDSTHQQILRRQLNKGEKKLSDSGPVSPGIMAIAKHQWKLEVLECKAQIADNLLLLEALHYQALTTHYQHLQSLPAHQLVSVSVPTASPDEVNRLSSANLALQEKYERIERKNKRKQDEPDERNEDQRQADHLIEESKRMEDRLKGYTMVEKIIRNPSEKLGYNVNRFIDRYLADESVPPIWEFIFAVRDQMMVMSDISGEEIESSLENYIFPILYNKMIEDLNLSRFDELVHSRCKQYGQTTQEQLNINPIFIDDALVPYVKAIAELRSIYFQFTPSKKMAAILRAASAVYEKTGQLQPDVTMGGDDFIDIWVYVVLHSQIRNLPSMVRYIADFASEDLMTSEMGYYFTSLELALNFLEKLSDESLKTSPSTQITSRPFVVCEKERYKIFTQVDKNVDLVQEVVEMEGFRMFAVERWVAQPGRFYSCYVQQTGDPSDKIFVSILQSNESISPSQQTFLYDTFFRDKPQENLQVRETLAGALLCSLQPPNESLGNVYPIVSGDFDAEIPLVKAVIALKALRRPVTPVPPYLTLQERQEFVRIYRIPVSSECCESDRLFAEAVVDFVRTVQHALRHLNFFPYLCKVDGVVSAVLIQAIQLYQQQYNESTALRYDGKKNTEATMNALIKNNIERPAGLPGDGTLTEETWKCICYRLQDLNDALRDLGFNISDDPLHEPEQFTEAIKAFESAHNLMPDGLLNQKTITTLVAVWEQQHSVEGPPSAPHKHI